MQIRNVSKGQKGLEPSELSSHSQRKASEFSSVVGCRQSEVKMLPITSTLRTLNIGQTIDFPFEQRTSVLATAARIKKELSRYGWDYSYQDDDDNFLLKFSRIN